MKTTMDYMVGNTAFQIVNTGKKIKVIDVEKEKVKKKFWFRLLLTSLVGTIFFVCCMTLLNLQNTKTLLDKQNFILETQIVDMEQENALLEKEIKEVTLDYQQIFKQAKALGMDFPTKDQIYEYEAGKSTVVRYKGLE